MADRPECPSSPDCSRRVTLLGIPRVFEEISAADRCSLTLGELQIFLGRCRSDPFRDHVLYPVRASAQLVVDARLVNGSGCRADQLSGLREHGGTVLRGTLRAAPWRL